MTRVLSWINNQSRNDQTSLVDRIFQALSEQTVVVPGTTTIEQTIPMLTANIKAFKQQRKQLGDAVERMLDTFPLFEILMSISGSGIKIISTILMTIGDCSDFADAAQLASYAGVSPTTRRSGM